MQHLIYTRAVERSCGCGSTVLAGLVGGRAVKVDRHPLDATKEIAALLEGRWTFALIHCGELVHRDAQRIRGGYLGESVHAEHRCPDAYRQLTLIGAA